MSRGTLVCHITTIAILDGAICAITTKRGSRWIVPRGHLKRSGAMQTAIDEAWEEAGISGRLCADPIGVYDVQKNGHAITTLAFLMDVSHVATQWPERSYRNRCWMSLKQFRRRIDDPELVRMAERGLDTNSMLWAKRRELPVHLL